MPRPRSALPRRYFKELRFRQFRAFCEVARTLSFSAAAETLRISRPSLWQQVRSLEEELGTDLLRTQGQQLSLTEDGDLLLDLITPLVESFESVKAIFHDRRHHVIRRLSVATTSSLLANELLRPVQLYREQHAKVHSHFVDRPSREALPLLDAGEADLAIVGLLDESPRPVSLEFEPWMSYPFVLICPPGHPLARARKLDLRMLIKNPLLLPIAATNARQRIESALREAKLFDRVNVVLESSSSLVLARYVEMGLGIAITSIGAMLAEELRSGSEGHPALAVREVTDLFGVEPVVIARRKGRHLLKHIADFQKLVRSAPSR